MNVKQNGKLKEEWTGQSLFRSLTGVLLLAALLLTGCAGKAGTPNKKVTAEEQRMDVTGIQNARELGGYATQDGTQVKKGLLLRTAQLGEATPEELQKLAETYHVAHVIDMRNSKEVASSPEAAVPSAQLHWVKIMDEQQMAQRAGAVRDVLADPNADQLTRLKACIEVGLVSDQMYVEYLDSEQGRAGYREFFRILLENQDGGAVLWHCTNGKDRTGVAAMLLLSALNVDEETILQDYMLTNEFFADELAAVRSKLEPAVQDEKLLEDMLVGTRGVSERYMVNALNYMKENYGSAVDYLKTELGLTDQDLTTLRQRYTEA